MGSILLSGLMDQNYGKKIGISGPRIYHVTTLIIRIITESINKIINGCSPSSCLTVMQTSHKIRGNTLG